MRIVVKRASHSLSLSLLSFTLDSNQRVLPVWISYMVFKPSLALILMSPLIKSNISLSWVVSQMSRVQMMPI